MSNFHILIHNENLMYSHMHLYIYSVKKRPEDDILKKSDYCETWN